MLRYNSKEVMSLKDDIVDTVSEIEALKQDMASMMGETYVPKFDIEEFMKYKSREDFDTVFDMIDTLHIDFNDERWKKADWIAVWIAAGVGMVADVLITQTNLLKPFDSFIKELLDSDSVNSFQDALDRFSNWFRNGKSAPIDYQDFEMAGLRSIHEQYSFGHDPLRFIEGIIQMMTGQYSGVDINGNPINAVFGEGIKNPLFAIVSYVAHMVSDMCNKQGLPYPGSTFLMQFGSQETRDALSAAYRSQKINFRTFIYQSIPSLLVSLVIHAWAIYDNYTRTGEIKIRISNNLKYQPMLLVANAMIAGENILVTGIRSGGFTNLHELFRINWAQIAVTIKHTIKYLKNEHKRIKENGQEIASLLEEYQSQDYSMKSHDEIQSDLDKEFEQFIKSMED